MIVDIPKRSRIINTIIANFLYKGKGDLEIFLKHPHMPNFYEDLNAMYRAEEKLNTFNVTWAGKEKPAWVAYKYILAREIRESPPKYPTEYCEYSRIHASAQQRAEAFVTLLTHKI